MPALTQTLVWVLGMPLSNTGHYPFPCLVGDGEIILIILDKDMRGNTFNVKAQCNVKFRSTEGSYLEWVCFTQRSQSIQLLGMGCLQRVILFYTVSLLCFGSASVRMF